MVFQEKLIFNHQDHIPKRFGNSKILNNLEVHSKLYRGLNFASFPPLCKNGQTKVSVDKTPLLSVPSRVKGIIQSSNFNDYKKLQNHIAADLKPLHDLVLEQGDAAWNVIKNENGQIYCSVWSNKGYIYTYCSSFGRRFSNLDNDYHALVEFGFFSYGTQVGGVNSFDLSFPSLFTNSSVSMMLAKTMSTIFKAGLGFNVGLFPLRLSQSAEELGLFNVNVIIPEYAIGSIVESIVFILSNVNSSTLNDTIHSRSIVHVYNWDKNSDWNISSRGINTLSPGIEQDSRILLVNIGKMNSDTLPIYNRPSSTNFNCHISSFIYQNVPSKSNSFSLQFIKSNSNQGFTCVFNSSSQGTISHNIQNRIIDPNTCTQQFSTSNTTLTSVNGVPISVSLDKNSNLNNIFININNLLQSNY